MEYYKKLYKLEKLQIVIIMNKLILIFKNN